MSDVSTDSYEQDIIYLRNILPFFKKYNIAPTPVNYTVLYEHVSGGNAQVTEAIDSLEKRGEKLTNEFCQQLFDNVIKDVNVDNLSQVQNEVSNIMQEVLSIISKANQDTADYGDMLSKSESELSEKPSIDSIMGMIGHLKEGTSTIRKRYDNLNETISGQLAEVGQLRTRIDKIKEEAGIDYLTQVANRKTFDEYIAQLIEDGNNFCLAMIDIDHFKGFNDDYGHLIGDKVLRYVADSIKAQIKGIDLISRFGGEEFSVVFPDTSLIGGVKASEHIRKAIEETRFINKKGDQQIRSVTVSIGVAAFQQGQAANELIEKADNALYKAKDSGRNQVQQFDHKV